MLISTDLSKLVDIGDKVIVPMGKKVLKGKVIETSILEWNRHYRIRWENGKKDWLNQAQIRVLTVN